MDKKKAKNLCFWCDERFTPGHRCKKKQLYVLQIKDIIDKGDIEQEDVKVEKGDDDGLASQLSLNAIWGLELIIL